MNKRISSNQIYLIRIVSALFIFLCHAFNVLNYSYSSILSQMFNVGVPIFFMISGYLYYGRDMPKNIFAWFLKRIMKLVLPLEILILILFVFYTIASVNVPTSTWISNIIPICGITQDYLPGCGHLWFISHILICYTLVPLLIKIKSKKEIKPSVLLVIYLIVAIASAYTLPQIFNTLVHSILSFLIGFHILPKMKPRLSASLFIGVCSIAIRVIGWLWLDNTVFYTCFLSAVTHKVLAISIIFSLCAMYEKISLLQRADKILKSAAKYTYEFYLIHQVFMDGPTAIAFFDSTLLNVLIAFIFSVMGAIFINFAVSVIEKIFGRITCK